MRHLVDNDVSFAAIYRKRVLHPVARRWLDKAKPVGCGHSAEDNGAKTGDGFPARAARSGAPLHLGNECRQPG